MTGMERKGIDGLELKPFAKVGRSLVATRPFPAGSVVLSDTALFQWDAAAPLPSSIQKLTFVDTASVPLLPDDATTTTTGKPEMLLPAVLAGAAWAFITHYQDPAARELVADMHVPDLPISEATIHLFTFARRLAQHIVSSAPQIEGPMPAEGEQLGVDALATWKLNLYAEEVKRFTADSQVVAGDDDVLHPLVKTFLPRVADSIQKELLHAMLAAKVNSHRLSNGCWCFLPSGSKLAHSCSPNVMFLPNEKGATFIAVKSIVPGECITFCYAGSKTMLHSTALRQAGLKASHLFVCRCSRCEGRDLSRQFPCPSCNKGDAETDGEDDVKRGGGGADSGWISRLGSEELLVDSDFFPEKLWRCNECCASFSDVDLAPILKKEAKLNEAVLALTNGCYQYKAMKALCTAVVAHVGRRHWTYAALCHHFAMYFRQMVRNGCTAARHLTFSWGIRYLATLQAQGFVGKDESMPHMLPVADIIVMAQTCGVVARYTKPLSRLCHVILPLLVALYSEDDTRVRHVASLAYAGGQFSGSSLTSPVTSSGASPTDGTSPTQQSPQQQQQQQVTSPTESEQRRASAAAQACSPSDSDDPRTKSLASALEATFADMKDQGSELELFSLWDRFVVLMVLKQQVEEGREEATPSLPGTSTAGSAAGGGAGSQDSLDAMSASDFDDILRGPSSADAQQ